MAKQKRKQLIRRFGPLPGGRKQSWRAQSRRGSLGERVLETATLEAVFE